MSACANCGEREGTLKWVGDGGALALFHGWYAMWCEQCVLAAQIDHAQKAVGRLGELQAKLAALSSEDATRPTSTSGPGCKNHRGDPHNLCEACWALEPAGCLPVTQEEKR